MNRKLRVFLCHASEDKPAVRELYQKLAAESWIEPWLDEEDLLPGQDWNLEINKATREADAILICMSKTSVEKEGYLNKEIRRVLDISNEKLEGAIYIIPLRLDDCQPSFERLKQIHYADYFTPNAHERLLKSLRLRADSLEIETSESEIDDPPVAFKAMPLVSDDDDLDLYSFIQIPATEDVPYSFYIGKYPVTNAQYERFLNAPDFAKKEYWVDFPKYTDTFVHIGKWESDGWDWLQSILKENQEIPFPGKWNDKNFGHTNPKKPIVGITWYEANAYCKWLSYHWMKLMESYANQGVQPRFIRLPLEMEWVSAAGGEVPAGRYPWDRPGIVTKNEEEAALHANIPESNIGYTTPVDAYLKGMSPYGVMDMAGNVYEWQANYYDEEFVSLAERGGSWLHYEVYGGVSDRGHDNPQDDPSLLGFRVMFLPK